MRLVPGAGANFASNWQRQEIPAPWWGSAPCARAKFRTPPLRSHPILPLLQPRLRPLLFLARALDQMIFQQHVRCGFLPFALQFDLEEERKRAFHAGKRIENDTLFAFEFDREVRCIRRYLAKVYCSLRTC